jgi:hypothetical protein
LKLRDVAKVRVLERRKIRFNETGLKSRRVTLGEEEDEPEAMFARGW